MRPGYRGPCRRSIRRVHRSHGTARCGAARTLELPTRVEDGVWRSSSMKPPLASAAPGYLVPTERPRDRADVERQAAARAEPVDFGLHAQRAQLLGDPTVERRVRQRVGRRPAGCPVLQRHGRVERARLDPHPQVIARDRDETADTLPSAPRIRVGLPQAEASRCNRHTSPSGVSSASRRRPSCRPDWCPPNRTLGCSRRRAPRPRHPRLTARRSRSNSQSPARARAVAAQTARRRQAKPGSGVRAASVAVPRGCAAFHGRGPSGLVSCSVRPARPRRRRMSSRTSVGRRSRIRGCQTVIRSRPPGTAPTRRPAHRWSHRRARPSYRCSRSSSHGCCSPG